MKVGIIGGGASGISAAISIKQNHKDVEVVILERFDKIGKKILATGNGKCNIGNLNLDKIHYNKPQFVSEVIAELPVNDYVNYLEQLGIFLSVDEEGRLYPFSNSSSAVLDVLIRNINKLGITVKTNANVIDVTKTKKGFNVKTETEEINFDKIIFSYGSSAQTKIVKSHEILKKFGHQIIKFEPALVGLKVEEKVSDLKGLRFKANVSLISNDQKVFNENGEVLFKEDGIGGIVILNASRHIVKGTKNILKLNFINDDNFRNLEIYLKTNQDLTKLEKLQGIVHKMMAQRLSKCQGDIKKLLQNFTLTISGNYGINFSQVARGGVNTNEVNPHTFESKLINGLYIIGEALDIDGACGGYNLYFAITSGVILGKNLFTNYEK